jgi:G3E family GTPase
VFRAKGILWIDKSDKRYLVQLVGKRFPIDEAEWVGTRKNRLVLLGRNLVDERLRHQLEACLALSSGGSAQVSIATATMREGL